MKLIIKSNIKAKSKIFSGASQYAYSMAPVDGHYMYIQSISTNFFTKTMRRNQDSGELMDISRSWSIGSKYSSKDTWDFIPNIANIL